MNNYFFEKVEKLKGQWVEVIDALLELYETNSFGMNNGEIGTMGKKLNTIQLELQSTLLKIPNEDQEDQYGDFIQFLKDKEDNLEELLNDNEEGNTFGMNNSVIGLLNELIRDNKDLQRKFENKLVNINSNTNSNKNTQSINFSFSPQLTQSQTVNVQVQNLFNELEKEILKPKPDKSKIKELLDTILKEAPQLLPFLSMLAKVLQKFHLL